MKCLVCFFLMIHFAFGQEKIDLETAMHYYDQGKEYYYDGKYEKAELAFDSCLIIRQKLLESPHELLLKIYQRIGNNYIKQREFTEGNRALMLAMEQAEVLFGEESAQVSSICVDLGVMEGRKHMYSKSTDWFEKSIAIKTKLYGPLSKEVAYVRMNNGNNLYSTGNYVKCINEYKKILEVYEKELEPDDENYNRVYLTLSSAYRKKGDLDNALRYAKKALEIKLLNYREDHPSVAKYYANVAKIQATLNQLDAAKKNFEKSAKIEEKNGSPEDYRSVLDDAARVLMKNGDFETAKEIFKASARFFPHNSRKNLIARENMALCLYYLGETELAIKEMKEVKERNPDVEGFITLSEWTRVSGIVEEATGFLYQAKAYLKEGDQLNSIKILVEEAEQQAPRNKDAAWNTINRAIIELTKLRRKYLGSESKNYINERLDYIFDFTVNLSLERYRINPTDKKLEDIYQTIEMAKAASFWDNLSEENAAFYGKVPIEVVEEIEILKDSGEEGWELLERKMTELEQNFPQYYNIKYSLQVPSISKVQSFLNPEMAIFDYYVLHDKIVALKIQSRSLELITSKNTGEITFQNELKSLASASVKRIAVIPHRFIHFESFEEIINPKSQNYLLYDFAFSYHMNVQSVFSENNTRHNFAYLGIVPEFDPIEHVHSADMRSELVPLPSAITEVNESAKLFDGKVYQGRKAVEQVFYQEASNYDYIHFATHAMIDPSNELNSYLYLTESEDEDDGILYADEIMKTDLNANLVILSACETGNGGLMTGEGVMSLSRAFQYAGAKSVLMSLWRANDHSAKPIIVQFLKNYKSGMTKDVALQKSKIQYLERADPLMSDVFYWAGFMINGDLSAPNSEKTWPAYLLAMLMVFLVVFLLFRFM